MELCWLALAGRKPETFWHCIYVFALDTLILVQAKKNTLSFAVSGLFAETASQCLLAVYFC